MHIIAGGQYQQWRVCIRTISRQYTHSAIVGYCVCIVCETVSVSGYCHGLLPAPPWWCHETKHFPCYWPFVRGIHRSPVNSPHKGQCCGPLMLSLICTLNKQSWGWWFETPSRSLWRHYNAIVSETMTLAVIILFKPVMATAKLYTSSLNKNQQVPEHYKDYFGCCCHDILKEEIRNDPVRGCFDPLPHWGRVTHKHQ